MPPAPDRANAKPTRATERVSPGMARPTTIATRDSRMTPEIPIRRCNRGVAKLPTSAPMPAVVNNSE